VVTTTTAAEETTMKTATTQAWTIRFEMMDGRVCKTTYHTATYSEAVTALCNEISRIANILSVHNARGRKVV
jgi:hypothetical protein